MKKIYFYVFIFIALIAFSLRLNRLGLVPGSMNADEVAIGYNAFSILKTGRDEYGEKFPLAFRSFDDYKAPLYIYLTVPSVAIFGLNDFAVRLPSAVAGIITVIMTFFLTKELLFMGKGVNKSKEFTLIPFVSMFLLAVSPWHLQFSRSAYEANLSVMFITIGIFTALRGFRLRNWLILVSSVSFSLSLWAYHTPRIFVPLLLIVFCILYWKEIKHTMKWVTLSVVVGAVILFPLGRIMLSPEGLVRGKGVSSLSEPSILNRSINWMNTDNSSGNAIFNIFHNRRIEYVRTVFTGYLSHFDPAFFFLERAEQKYRAPGMGLMYVFELPFLLFGMYWLFRNRNRESILLLLWLLLAPIAASPTMRLPHPVRTIVFLPALQIISACGCILILGYILKQTPNNKFIRILSFSGFGLIVTTMILYYLHQYYVHMPIDYASDWQFGHKEVVEKVKLIQDNYDTIVVSTSLDQPQIFFLYYLQYNPKIYLSEGGTKSGKFDADQNKFSKYIFTSRSKASFYIKGKTLFISLPSEVIKQNSILYSIKYPNGTIAYTFSEL